MPLCNLPNDLSAWIVTLAAALDPRVQHRLLGLLTGLLFARGRRTVTSWLRAAGLSKQFRPHYYFLASVGRRTARIAVQVLLDVAWPILVGNQPRLLFGLDDTPTCRYGPKVQGAGIHHNPTPGPADQTFLYGHVWVTLAWLAPHRLWGTIALPLLARLYIRQKDVARLPKKYHWKFQTKLEQAAELLRWLVGWLGHKGKAIWLVADGAYAKKELLRPARKLGVVVVSRLRHDSALWSVPSDQRPSGQPGPLPTYGKQRISLAKRAGHRHGWTTEKFVLYRRAVAKTYKTFLATWHPAGGLIRVVLVQEEGGWKAYFATDPQASVADILTAVADRGAIEQAFHDLKEIWGLGQQQVRNLWANIGVFHLNLWMHTLVELWAWERPAEELTDRKESPWDDGTRRPSHADRRKALQRASLEQEYQAADSGGGDLGRIRRLARRLLKMVA
jgi:DDE superfamily endonuclease